MALTPSRAAGLAALASFVPDAGRRYAEQRNFDHGPQQRTNVSVLSPYIRYRLITEAEVVASVRQAHSASAAEKFLQEVLWRTYWKGWLELRPSVWTRYHNDVQALQGQSGGWRAAYDQALAGTTGIDCFDAWMHELVGENYLHNHARMWFASIWIFTLRLPWQLGAALFYQHLYDGDPASNTLSWRWVAGLQTAGKTYLATADNIRRYTNGRFDPRGLASTAAALSEPPTQPQPLAPAASVHAGHVGLLIAEDDLCPETLNLGSAKVVAIASAAVTGDRAAPVDAFTAGALDDARTRADARFGAPAEALSALTPAAVRSWAAQHALDRVLVGYAPVGPGQRAIDAVTTALADDGIVVEQVRRPWDSTAWPEARRGYFAFRQSAAALIA